MRTERLGSRSGRARIDFSDAFNGHGSFAWTRSTLPTSGLTLGVPSTRRISPKASRPIWLNSYVLVLVYFWTTVCDCDKKKCIREQKKGKASE